MGRAASDTAIWKVGCPRPELELVDLEPEAIRRNLSERSPGTLAHIMSSNLHYAGTILAQHRFGLGLKHQRRKGRRTQAPADQQSILVTHLPWCERTALPAEALSALRVTVA